MEIEYKAAIFDFDGVIVDSERRRLKTYELLFRELFNKKIAFVEEELIGNSEIENIKKLLKQNDVKYEDLSFLLKRRHRLLMKEAEKGFSFHKSIMYIIKEINKINIPYVICSNSTKDYVERALIKNEYVKPISIVVPEGGLRPKPFTDMLEKAIELLKMSKKNILGFEDSISGLEAYNRMSMDCVYVKNSYRMDKINYKYIMNNDDLNDAKKILKLFGVKDD